MKPRVLFLLKSLDLGSSVKIFELFSKYAQTFEPILLYNASNDLTRLPNFKTILPDTNIFSYGENSECIDLIYKIAPNIIHQARGGSPEFPEPNYHLFLPHDVKFIETNVFGLINNNPQIHKTLFMSRPLMGIALSQYKLKPSRRFDYLYNPVEIPITQEKFDLGLDKETIILGRIGRNDPGIYCDINVKATAQLIKRGFKVHFLSIATPQNMKDDLKRMEVPHTCLEASILPLELSKFYNTIDILAHSRADGETAGTSIYEAMIHSKSIVTHIAKPSYRGMGYWNCHIETLKEANCGFWVDSPDAVCDYTNKLELLIENYSLRNNLGANGKYWALASCEAGLVTRKLEKVYESL